MALIAAAGCSGKPAVELTPAQAHGRRLFAANCASCHGANGVGGAIGPKLTGGRTLATFATAADQETFIARGTAKTCDERFTGSYGTKTIRTVEKHAMPCWKGKLTEREIRDVVDYERTL